MPFDFPSSPTVGQQYSPVAGTTYTYNGVGWTLAQSTIATVTQIKVITASGTYTPSSGLVSAIVECVGGGGAGGAAIASTGVYQSSGGGGSGGYSRRILTAAQIGASQTATVGAGGIGSTGNGTNGGDTSLGTLVIAKGGLGALANAAGNQPGAAGGTITGAVGDIVFGGVPGGSGAVGTATIANVGGFGGSSAYGGGAVVPPSAGAGAGIAATNYGSGGSGGVKFDSGTSAGGNGSPGIIIVTEFIAVSAVPAPGFPVQIQRIDVSSAVATVDFTSGIDATYDEYELHLVGVNLVTSGQQMAFRVSTDGGATWKSGANDYGFAFYLLASNAAGANSCTGTATQIVLDWGSGNNAPLVGHIKFAGPSVAQIQTFRVHLSGWNSTNGYYNGIGSGFYNNLQAINGIRFFGASGSNIAKGTFILYGIKK